MLIAISFIVVAIIVLYFGAEFSLEASEKIGEKLGMPPLVVGMLLVGFGTSLPEMFVGHIAVANGKPIMAIGSLVGSNLANMLLILGICGLIVPIQIFGRALKEQLVVHLIMSSSLIWILAQAQLDVISVVILFTICLAYLILLFKEMKSSKGGNQEDSEFRALIVTMKLIFGFAMLYIGGELLIKGGVDLCSHLGISEYIVSAIFIAFGTSFPELVTSLVACFKKKETDLIIGNIIGSNLFNCAFILGSLGFYSINLTQGYTRETIGLVTGALLLLIIGLRGKSFHRLSGLLFLCGYGAIVGSWLKLY